MRPRSGWVDALGLRWSLWALGVLAGLAVGVRTFGGGLLLNWDQVIGRSIPIPSGLWGLGPELPRRVPFYVPLSLVSEIMPGPAVVAVLLVASTAVAFVGMARLGGGPWAPLLGLAYAWSPFVLTRASVGHLPLVAATALLPWLLADVDVERAHGGSEGRLRRILWWGAVFSVTGSSGALIGLVPLTLAVLLADASIVRRARSLAMLAVTQIAWVVPGIVVVLGGVGLPASATEIFEVEVDGLGGWSRAVAGGGFFLSTEDVAERTPLAAAILGLVLLGAGVAGLVGRRRPDVVSLSAIAGAVLVFAPVVPGLAGVWDAIVDVGPLALLRESHKFWPLIATGLLVGAGRTVADLGSTVRRSGVNLATAAGTLGLITVVAAPGLLGAGGRLIPSAEPESLSLARSVIADDPDRTVVFPWFRYDELSVSDGRTVLQPAPWIIDGQVLTATQPFTSVDSNERREPLADLLADLDTSVRGGEQVAADLRSLSIRYVLITGSADADLYRRIGNEADVTTIVDDGSVLLFDTGVRTPFAWDGSPPLRVLDVGPEGETVRWERPCESGWLAELSGLTRSDSSCSFPSNTRLLWFPPAVVTLGAQIALLVMIWRWRPRRLGRMTP